MDFFVIYVNIDVGTFAVQQAVRVIRKYGNRRLYDTTSKRYVNLDEIAQMIRDGDEVQVVDAKTSEDLTRGILTQIIVEDSKTQGRGLPLEILREIIALSDRAKHEGLMWYLRTAFDTYRRAQHAPVEFMRSLFTPRTHESAAELEELRRRIEELERSLAKDGKPS
jgi:polyhydroxyalkanoate synthesis repressor PhaR